MKKLTNHNRFSNFSLLFSVLFLSLCQTGQADILAISRGNLTINFNSTALATETDTPEYSAASGEGALLAVARHYTASEVANRRLTTGNNRNGNIPQIRPLVNIGTTQTPVWTADIRDFRAQYDANPPSSTGLNFSVYDVAPSNTGLPLRFPQNTNMVFDTSIGISSVTGQIGLGGATAFYFANNNFLTNNSPGTWIGLGDYSFYFDSSRVSSETSGWVFSNHLGVSDGAIAFDTANTSFSLTSNSFLFSGDLIVAQDLSGFTALRTGANVGSFSLQSFSAVPEPSSMLLLGAVAAGGFVVKRRRNRKMGTIPKTEI
jgi:hypothetical protein